MSDWSDALDLYGFIARPEDDGTEHILVCTIPGAPPSKARVRFSGKHAYNDAQQVAAERRTATYVAQSLRGQKFLGNVAVGAIFYRPNHQRVDADNMLKHVCDAINGLAFADDSQVTSIYGRIELDKNNPRTVLVLGPHLSTMTRGLNDTTPCKGCGAPVSVVGKRSVREPARYCSRECFGKARRVDLTVPVPCASCQQPFRRPTSYRKYCSKTCSDAALRGSRKRVRQYSSCKDCGKQLTHNRGGRCRDCWRLNGTKITKVPA